MSSWPKGEYRRFIRSRIMIKWQKSTGLSFLFWSCCSSELHMLLQQAKLTPFLDWDAHLKYAIRMIHISTNKVKDFLHDCSSLSCICCTICINMLKDVSFPPFPDNNIIDLLQEQSWRSLQNKIQSTCQVAALLFPMHQQSPHVTPDND